MGLTGGLGEMQAAFLLHAMEPRIPFVVIVRHQGTAGMPIANGGIAEIKKGVIGEVVAGEIGIDILGVPGEDGENFVKIPLTIDKTQRATVLGLIAA